MKLRILIHRFSPTRHSSTFASLVPFARNPASFILHTSSFILPLLLLSACASSQPRPVADRYTRENSSQVVSRGPVPMDDAEARRLTSGGQATRAPVKKKTVTSGGRVTKSSEESITATTTTETVVGSQAVAAPDAEVTPR